MEPRLDSATGRRLLAVAITLTVVCLGSCETAPRGAMISIPPPGDWEEKIAENRDNRDEYFKSSPDTPLLTEDLASFSGLDYWEPDRELYFVGPLNLHPNPERFEIVSTAGKIRPCEKLGWIGFRVGDQDLRLQVYRLLDGEGGLFLPFTDETTGEETYPAGRYVDLVGPQGGPYVLDFNMAYNPFCAYGAPERYQCPVTPKENRLAVRIQAGERGFRHPPEARPAEG